MEHRIYFTLPIGGCFPYDLHDEISVLTTGSDVRWVHVNSSAGQLAHNMDHYQCAYGFIPRTIWHVLSAPGESSEDTAYYPRQDLDYLV